jgi:hypothetical protein
MEVIMLSCLCLITTFLLVTFTLPIQAVTIYVPDDFDTIQAGIDVCVDGDTVLVADGTYTGNGNRDIDFTGKAIVLMSENGPEVTIIDCEGSVAELHRGFYFYSGEEMSSVIQGFTITNGWAGIGGGMYNDQSNPTVTNCMFIGNSTVSIYGAGGGLYNDQSSPTVTNCMFIGNSAIFGGGMYNYYSSPTVTNCMFTENSATWGGGMSNDLDSSPMVTNCTFTGNSAIAGGGMYSAYCSPTITSCIFWGDLPDEIYGGSPIVTYSDVQGGYKGEGNIDEGPLFVSFHGFDYLLRRFSPCIDAGDPDLDDGFEWPNWYMNGRRGDMGAYGGPGNVNWLP